MGIQWATESNEGSYLLEVVIGVKRPKKAMGLCRKGELWVRQKCLVMSCLGM